MARILQYMIYLTVMTTVGTERGYFYHNTYQGSIVYPTEYPSESPEPRTQYHTPISKNLTKSQEVRNQRGQEVRNQRGQEVKNQRGQEARIQDARSHRIEAKAPQGVQRIENGTYKITNRIQLNKRGALEDSILSPNDRIVFPEPVSSFRPPRIPEECRKKGYCESVPDYPTEFVKKLVDQVGNSVIYQMDDLDEDVQIAQRLGGSGSDQEIELCDFSEQIMKPPLAEDKDGNWHTVINPPGNPLQGFRTEICNTGSCSPIASIQEGYKASCKQKYSYRMMSTVNKDGQIEQKSLKLPSCCACVITVNPFKK